MRPIPLLVPPSAGLTEHDLLDLHDAVLERAGLPLAPVRHASASLLPELLERSPDALAWAPSSIAFLLARLCLAAPLVVAKVDADAAPRSSVLLARRGINGLVDLRGRRMGWVSRFSITGYYLPRLYLESFGVDVEALFGPQEFHGSHEAAADALAHGRADVIATDSRRVRAVLARAPARLLASVGPVPSDVLVAGPALSVGILEPLARELCSLRIGCVAFEPVRDGHFDLYELLRRHASDASQRTRAAGATSMALTS
jgi:ABC-type phosphate/phosphonate transport system substrate-binding protein